MEGLPYTGSPSGDLLLRLLEMLDAINSYAGRAMQWIVMILIGLVVVEVTARYVFNAPTVWSYQVQIVVAASLFALSWGYAQITKSHVRVDVLYQRLSRRGQILMDVIGYLLFFFPLLTVLTVIAFDQVLWSFRVKEVLAESYWYPPAQPLRIVVFLGLSLFHISFTTTFVRDLRRLFMETNSARSKS